MSTKMSLRYHSEKGPGGGWFHLYRDCFDEENEFVYLELGGVPFEGSNSIDLSGNGLSRVAVRLPNAWALELGLVGERPAAQTEGELSETDSKSMGAEDPFALDLALPQGIDPAILPSIRHGIAQAVRLLLSTGQTAILEQADQLAGLVTGLIEPDLGLVTERIDRMRTIRTMFNQGEWLSSEMLNQLQSEPPSDRSMPASDWKRRGLIFSVNFSGKEYFPRYEFDSLYQPLPVIRDILKAFGSVADSWKLAAWFHFPNSWIVEPRPEGPTAVAPKDALNRREDLLNALTKRQGSYAV